MSALELRSSDGRLVRTARSHILTDLADTSFRGDASAQPGLTASSIRGATEARTNSSPRRARHKPSTHCAGKAGLFPASPVVLPCALLAQCSAQGPRVPAGTRSSLRPLSGKRARNEAKLGHVMPREHERMSGGRLLAESAPGVTNGKPTIYHSPQKAKFARS